MLIDWPEQKAPLNRALMDSLSREAHRGVVAAVPRLTLHEGDKVTIIYPDGKKQKIRFRESQARVTFSREEFLAGGPELAAKAVHELARELHDEMDKYFVGLLQKVSPQHGGSFGGKNDEEMFTDLMRGMREMQMTFEDDGRASLFFVTHPDNIYKFQALKTPDRQQAFDELIEEKRREWLHRESYRRLVD